MGYKIIPENKASEIMNYLRSNLESMFISDELQANLECLSVVELRHLLFQNIFTCIGLVKNGEIISLAILGMPAQDRSHPCMQLLALSSDRNLLKEVYNKLSFVAAEDNIKKIIAFLNVSDSNADLDIGQYRKLLEYGFHEDYELHIHLGKRKHLSLFLDQY